MGILVGILVLPVFHLPPAQASWLIDPARFHASAHGQISCGECHEDVPGRELHPDPRLVTREAADFFQPEECLGCHDGIMDDLQGGGHGKLTVKDRDSYRDCLRCHEPHYLTRISDPKTRAFQSERPVNHQCGVCHEARQRLPDLSEEDRACMACHRSVSADDPEDTKRLKALCLHCHGTSGTEAQGITQEFVPLIDEDRHGATPHADLPCTTCHRHAASYTHDAQQPEDCGRCHLPHHEKVSGSAHMTVSCQACHLKGVQAVRDQESARILWERERSPDGRSVVHEMVRFETETACKRCHYAGNLLGAASMVLPPKSILCMPCHAATFSVGDTITVASLVIFLLGMVLFGSWVLSGSLGGTKGENTLAGRMGRPREALRCLSGRGLGAILRTLFWDVLLQRRLYRLSAGRWAIHALIFYGFAVRFLWGLAALVGSVWKPDWPIVWHLVNKDYPGTAFLYDLTGVMILVGVGLAFGRGWVRRRGSPTGLPAQDRPALGLIAAVVIIGFILEGMRIALNGHPSGSEFSFIGYGIGLLFESPRGLVEVYGFVWYIHAALTGAFVAYIPFSRLLHIILGPVTLAINACQGGRGLGD